VTANIAGHGYGRVCAGCSYEDAPGLRLVTVEDLVGPDQVQLPVALLEHVDPRQPAGRGDERLLHGGRVHQLPVLDGAGGQRGGGVSSYLVSDSTA